MAEFSSGTRFARAVQCHVRRLQAGCIHDKTIEEAEG